MLLTSLLLLTVQTRGGGPARAGDLVALALTPVQNLLTKAHRGALSVWNSYADWKRVRAENLTVNRGRADGVAQQMPVIVPDGLVGRVVQVRAGASVVQLLNDPTSTVGAVVQRTRTAGLVEGEPGGGLRFKFMARDGTGVAAGDLIVTSGLGTLFPKGIPVGRVTAIEDKGSALFHFAVLVPVVDFARVEEVLVLTGQASHDVASLFTPDG